MFNKNLINTYCLIFSKTIRCSFDMFRKPEWEASYSQIAMAVSKATNPKIKSLKDHLSPRYNIQQ